MNEYFTKMENRFIRSVEFYNLSLSAMRVFCLLKDRCNSLNHEAWISAKDGAILNLKPSTLRWALKELVKVGFIVKVATYKPGSRYTGYKINMAFVSPHPPIDVFPSSANTIALEQHSANTIALEQHSANTIALEQHSANTIALETSESDVKGPPALIEHLSSANTIAPSANLTTTTQESLSINSKQEDLIAFANTCVNTAREAPAQAEEETCVGEASEPTSTASASASDEMTFNPVTRMWEGIDAPAPAPVKCARVRDWLEPCGRGCEELIVMGESKGKWFPLDPGTLKQHRCSQEAMALAAHRKRLMAEAEALVEHQVSKGKSYTVQSWRDADPLDVVGRMRKLIAATKANPTYAKKIAQDPKFRVSNYDIARALDLPYPVSQASVPKHPGDDSKASGDSGCSGDSDGADGDYEMPDDVERRLPSQLNGILYHG